jgi:hypothetical protein
MIMMMTTTIRTILIKSGSGAELLTKVLDFGDGKFKAGEGPVRYGHCFIIPCDVVLVSKNCNTGS